MTITTDETAQLIDLYGFTTGIIRRSTFEVVYYFMDKTYGQLLVTAPKDCILYYEMPKGKIYHLKVALKGKLKQGMDYPRNNLIIKYVKEMGHNESN